VWETQRTVTPVGGMVVFLEFLRRIDLVGRSASTCRSAGDINAWGRLSIEYLPNASHSVKLPYAQRLWREAESKRHFVQVRLRLVSE
jgi:hypothetical protein